MPCSHVGLLGKALPLIASPHGVVLVEVVLNGACQLNTLLSVNQRPVADYLGLVAHHVHLCFQARKRLTQSDHPQLAPYSRLKRQKQFKTGELTHTGEQIHNGQQAHPSGVTPAGEAARGGEQVHVDEQVHLGEIKYTDELIYSCDLAHGDEQTSRGEQSLCIAVLMSVFFPSCCEAKAKRDTHLHDLGWHSTVAAISC